jgi:hypothetical protein
MAPAVPAPLRAALLRTCVRHIALRKRDLARQYKCCRERNGFQVHRIPDLCSPIFNCGVIDALLNPGAVPTHAGRSGENQRLRPCTVRKFVAGLIA